ncbi:MAG: SIMPL domain-containing protein [Flavobacteriales bacterium]|nr:SIMPL domain-containing protein [Flavobacteriales bacterium]
MKKLYTLLFMSLCFLAFSQEQFPSFIDVTGTAEMEVIPDEIYIAITLRERSGNRGTQTVQEQENDLKDALRSLGLDLKRLELSDANADYISIRWLNKKTISQSSYRFKAEDAYMVSKVFEQLDKLNIQDAYISEVSHSKIKEYEKEVRINAIKDAKDRADYLLTAIDERRGKAMEVYENRSSIQAVRRKNARHQVESSIHQMVDLFSGEDNGLQFQKIKLQASVFVKFGIE